MMNKLNKGLVVIAMAGLVFTTNVPSVQVSAASKSCVTSNCNKSNSCTTKKSCTTSNKSNCSNSTCQTGKTFTSGSLCFKVTGGDTAACTGFKQGCSNSASCTIPSTVKCNGKTYNVTQIASNAFSNCDSLKTIKVGNCVKTIGKNAFSGCDKLNNVSLGNSVNKVCSNAFSNCKKLKVINCAKEIKNCATNCFGNADCKVK